MVKVTTKHWKFKFSNNVINEIEKKSVITSILLNGTIDSLKEKKHNFKLS